MARESTITYEMVAQVADSILEKGDKPTARAVREVLGKGSMATILKLLQQYLARQARQGPLGIEDLVSSAIARAINTHLTVRVQEATTEVETRFADLQGEVASLIAESERQTNELLVQAGELEALRTQHSALTGRAAQMVVEAETVAVELANQRRAAELARQGQAISEHRLSQVPAVMADLERARADLAESHTKAATLHEAAAVATAKLEAAEAAYARSEKWHEATASELSGLRASKLTVHDLKQAKVMAAGGVEALSKSNKIRVSTIGTSRPLR